MGPDSIPAHKPNVLYISLIQVYTPFTMTSVTLTHIPFADINKSDRTSWHYEVNEGKFLSVSPPQWVFPIAKFKYISVYQHTFTHASVPLSSCCIADGSDLAKSQAVRCALCSPPDMQLSNYRPGKTFTPSTAGPVSAKTKCSKWESPSVLFYSIFIQLQAIP